jgi:ADP-ribosylglycohydrolase
MKADESLHKISIEVRFRGAIWGQFVGDAAALGTHWIYDLTDLQQQFPSGINGFEAPREGHYHYGKKPGDQTHYGDGALVLLESLAREGRFDAHAFGRSFVATFRPDRYSGSLRKSDPATAASSGRLSQAIVRWKTKPNAEPSHSAPVAPKRISSARTKSFYGFNRSFAFLKESRVDIVKAFKLLPANFLTHEPFNIQHRF